MYQYFTFYDQIIFYCVDKPHSVYPFTRWWVLGLYIVNNAALNISAQIFVWRHLSSFLLSLYLKIEIAGQMITLYLIFWGTPRMMYKVTVPFTFPLACMRVLISPHTTNTSYSILYTLPIFLTICVDGWFPANFWSFQPLFLWLLSLLPSLHLSFWDSC